MKTYYGLTGKFTVQPGKCDEFVAILLQAAEMLRSNPNCIHYLISTTDDQNDVWVHEIWTDEQAHDASLQPAEIQELIRQAMPLIAGPPEQTVFHVVGGKGI